MARSCDYLALLFEHRRWGVFKQILVHHVLVSPEAQRGDGAVEPVVTFEEEHYTYSQRHK